MHKCKWNSRISCFGWEGKKDWLGFGLGSVILISCWTRAWASRARALYLRSVQGSSVYLCCLSPICMGLVLYYVLFTCLWEKLTETETARAHSVFFILQKHIVLLLWLYTNKYRPFAVSNNTLFLSVRSKSMRMFSSFCGHQEKMRDCTGVG